MIIKDPNAEVKIDKKLVQQLINTQFPTLSNLSITFLDAGWDNENYRLGDNYIIRLPRREVAIELLVNEIKWLPKLQEKLPIAIPAPIYVGQPDDTYPWQWTIIPWVDGQTANLEKPQDAAALQLIAFLKILHQKSPINAPINLSRGVPLKDKAEDISQRIERLKEKTDCITPKIEALWATALNAPFPTEKYLLHGDLHPRNIIISEGKINAIIDWGDITDGDVASDLASLWMLFDKKSVRQQALKAYGASPDLVDRAIGWAVFYGVILLDTGLVSNEQHAKIGAFTLENLNQEETIL